MSAIKFFGEFDTKKLVEQIKASTKNFTDWAKDVGTKTASVDTAINKNKETFKASINEQKEILKQMISNLGDMEKAYEKATVGKQKMQASQNLRVAKADIEEEKNYIKKLEEEYDTLKKKKEEAADPGSKIGNSLKTWALGLLTVAAAMKVFKDIMEATTVTAESFHEKVNQLKSVWQVLSKAFATGDFSDLPEKFKKAGVAAVEYTKAMEEISNIRREIDIKALGLRQKIAEARAVMMEDQNTSDEKKKEAGENMIKWAKEIAGEEIKIQEMLLKAIADKTSSVNLLTAEQIKLGLTNWTQVMEIGKKFNEYEKTLSYEGKSPREIFPIKVGEPAGVTLKKRKAIENIDYAEVRRAQYLLGENAAMYGAIAKGYDLLSKAEKDMVGEAIKGKAGAEVELADAQRTAGRLLRGVKNRILDERNAAEKEQNDFDEAEKQKRIDNAIEIQQSLLNAEVDGAEKRRKQAELDYIKTINNLDKQKAETIKKRNEASGGIDKKTGALTATYTGGLSGIDLEQDTQLRTAAERERNAKFVEIDNQSAEEIKKINKEITDSFLSEMEKEVAAINYKYDEYIKKAKEAGAVQEELDFIEAKRIEELAIAQRDATLKITQFYRDVFGDLSKSGYASIKRIAEEANFALGSAKQTNIKGKTYFIVSIPDINAEGEAIVKNVTMTIEEFQALQKKYNELANVLDKRNPFAAIGKSFKEVVAALKSGDKNALSDSVERFNIAVGDGTKLIKSWADSLGMLTGGDSANKLNAITEALQGAAMIGTGLSQFATGDIVGGITNTLEGLVQVMAAISSMSDKYAKQIEKINELLLAQQYIVEQSTREGGESEARKKELELMQQKYDASVKQYNHDKKWWRAIKDKSDVLKQERADIAANKIELDRMEQEYKDFLNAGITENTIADTIAQGFAEGKTSVDDFADYMNNVLLDAVKTIFNREILNSPLMQDYMSLLGTSLSDNALTPEEIARINALGKTVSDTMKPLWDALTGGLDLGLDKVPGLSGAIQRSITENTATELAGLMRRIADDVRMNKDRSLLGINHLVAIEANTLNTVSELKNAVIELKAINTNTKPVYAGDL